jgi:hypothetical protein
MVFRWADDRQAFDTHFNYADCLATLLQGATLQYVPKLERRSLPDVDEKQNLISLTKRSLEQEHRLVEIDADYSYASTSWLPVKGYYLLFNFLLTVQYIIDCQSQSLRRSHEKCIRAYTRMLSRDELTFDPPILGSVFDRAIFDHREEPGANLSRRTPIDRRFQMAMAKGADYKLDDWKRRHNVPHFRTKEARRKRDEYLASFAFSIFEFPYYMRLRANYRDFAFIEGIGRSETARYFRAYYDFIIGFADALEGLRRGLIAVRRT